MIFITFLVTFDLAFFRAAVSNFKICAVPAGLLVIITPESIVEINVGNFL